MKRESVEKRPASSKRVDPSTMTRNKIPCMPTHLTRLRVTGVFALHFTRLSLVLICRWIFCDFQGGGPNANGGAETVATCYGEVVVFSPRVTARSNIAALLDLYWPAGAFKSWTCHPSITSPSSPHSVERQDASRQHTLPNNHSNRKSKIFPKSQPYCYQHPIIPSRHGLLKL